MARVIPGVVSLSALALLSAGAAGQNLLSDGDFEGLSPGSPPDCDQPAGAWLFPANYVDAGLCETEAEFFRIEPTSSLDPEGEGLSLLLKIGDPNPNLNFHVTNIFKPVNEGDGLVTVDFDVFVAEGGFSGASIYVGGDHGGGGYANTLDRGPQISWLDNGNFVAWNNLGQQTVLVEGYPAGAWQSIRLVIDLVTDTYDLFWGKPGGGLKLVGDDLVFRSGTLNHIDRVSVAHFGASTPIDVVMFDNFSVTVEGGACYPDCDESGVLNLFDFLCFVGAFNAGDGYADCNNSGDLNLFDFLCFVGAFNDGC